tara:strand:- start:4193 stop:4921 length:729 start_codon:yes stop_codon:yes gene_type:complete
MINTVGIIGYGHFGRFLHLEGNRFFSEVDTRVYSRRATPDFDTFYDFQTVAQSDVVILCCPIREYEETLQEVLKHALPETVIIDVATVKKHTNDLMEKYCGDRHYISSHPMFGPESYSKQNGNVTGFRIVVADYSLPNDMYQQLKNAFATLGFVIVEMSSDEHDKRLAETLFLTHYVGQSIVEAGFDRTEIDTVSFNFLMDAVESVKDDRGLFEDVYHFNPYCKDVASRLHKAQEDVFKSLV